MEQEKQAQKWRSLVDGLHKDLNGIRRRSVTIFGYDLIARRIEETMKDLEILHATWRQDGE